MPYRTRESASVWQPLHKQLNAYKWHSQRIECSGMLGIPDVNIHVPGVGDVWLELKWIKDTAGASFDEVKTPDKLCCLGLRLEQFLWIKDGIKAGRRCFLLGRTATGAWWLWNDVPTLAEGRYAAIWSKVVKTALRFETGVDVLEYLKTI